MTTNRYIPTLTTKVVGVCSGNIQRSATFEAVMNQGLAEKKGRRDGLDFVTITGTGTNVLEYLTNTEKPERVIKILNSALKYGVVPTLAIDEVRKYAALNGNAEAIRSLADADKEQLRLLHRIVRPELSRMNIHYRDEALRQRGIDPSRLVSAKPFRPEQGYHIVLGMEDEATKKAAERYSSDPVYPVVDVLEADIPGQRMVKTGQIQVVIPQLITSYAAFVGGSPVKEDLSGGLEGALAHVDYFIETRDRFFTKLVESMVPNVVE